MSHIEYHHITNKYSAKIIILDLNFILTADTADFLGLAYILHPALTWGRSRRELMVQLREEMLRYIALHKRLFGTDYIPYLPPRPSARVLREIRGSFSDFLMRNNLPLFETLAYTGMTRAGYGQPHRFGAIYGLTLITPKLIENLYRTGLGGATLIESGFLAVLHYLIRKFNIDTKLNVHIDRIRRNNDPKGNVQVYFKEGSNRGTYLKYYDFLVVAVPMNSLFGVIDASPTERNISRHLITDTFFVDNLCDSAYGKRQENPYVIYPEKLLRYDYQPYQERDLYALFNNISGKDYQMGKTQGGADGFYFQVCTRGI